MLSSKRRFQIESEAQPSLLARALDLILVFKLTPLDRQHNSSYGVRHLAVAISPCGRPDGTEVLCRDQGESNVALLD
jgi:hypothetical protein